MGWTTGNGGRTALRHQSAWGTTDDVSRAALIACFPLYRDAAGMARLLRPDRARIPKNVVQGAPGQPPETLNVSTTPGVADTVPLQV